MGLEDAAGKWGTKGAEDDRDVVCFEGLLDSGLVGVIHGEHVNGGEMVEDIRRLSHAVNISRGGSTDVHTHLSREYVDSVVID